MTLSACSRASFTSEWWPACRLPIVGTKPTRKPSRFHAATRARKSARSVEIHSAIARPLFVGVRGVGEGPAAHRFGVGAHGAGERTAFGQEILHELRAAMARVRAEQIVQHQHLAIALRARTDADGGDRARVRDR